MELLQIDGEIERFELAGIALDIEFFF